MAIQILVDELGQLPRNAQILDARLRSVELTVAPLASTPRPMVTWMTLEDIAADPTLMDAWNASLSTTTNLYAMYHSPVWLSCYDSRQRQIAVAVRRHDGDAARVDIAPMMRRNIALCFRLSPVVDFSIGVDAIELLGSQCLGGQSYEGLSEIVASVWETFPAVDCIYLKSVSNESKLWVTLAENRWRVGESPVYKPDGDRPFHYVALPPTYEEYMASFPPKQRFTLKKKIRKMSEAFPGKWEARRIADTADVDFLTASARLVAGKSWKAERLERAVPESIEKQDLLRNVAAQGLLRSYVLLADGRACAFIVGYCYNGIFHYADLAYDSQYAPYSPGTVLLLGMIQNLIEQDGVQFINFGITDAQYKRVFGNMHLEDATMLILRPSVSITVRVGLHRAFRDAKALARRLRFVAR